MAPASEHVFVGGSYISTMRFLLILILGTGLVFGKGNEESVEYAVICRLRVTSVSRQTAEEARNEASDLQFELPSSPTVLVTWQNTDLAIGQNEAEILYRIFTPDITRISGVSYSTAGTAFRDLSPDQISIRCSNSTVMNRTHGLDIAFTQSFNATLGIPESSTEGRIRRSVTLHIQDQVDCLDPSGYVHPYSLGTVDRYVADGETYMPGCSLIAKCTNGKLSAVSRCAPQFFPLQKFVMVRKVGECCQDGFAKDKIEASGCPKSDDGVAFKNDSSEPSWIPWQVRFSKQDGSFCDGAIINKNWFLTTKDCLNSTGTTVFLRPDSIKCHPHADNPKNVTIIEIKDVTNDSNLQLSLAKLNAPFVPSDWTTAIQPVTLPWGRAICEKFQERNCHVLLGTEQRNGTEAAFITGIFNSSGEIQKRTDAGVLPGSGVVSWYDKAHFLVGINSDLGNLISICSFLDAIRDQVGNVDD